jgi:hypothetical protein
MNRRHEPQRFLGVRAGVLGVRLGVLEVVIGVCVRTRALVQYVAVSRRPGTFRRTRSSGRSGGVGGLRVCRGGTLRGLLRACTSVDRLVDYLLDRAVDTLPAPARARFAEEWQDHRQHYCGWRLVWWALWVRATVLRTVTALGSARLPREG